MTLSVLRLKALLEQRGISYDSVVEKSELTELVEASGKVPYNNYIFEASL